VPPLPEGVRHICIGDDIADSEGVFAQRFDATPSAAFLLRPDQHLVARWRHVDVAKVVAARDRALGKRA
jgi:3-(3-hydroxy-phenyl)propionate hydroxylase